MMFKYVASTFCLSGQERLMVDMQAFYQRRNTPTCYLNLSIEWQVPRLLFPVLDVLKSVLYDVVRRNPNLRVVFGLDSKGEMVKKLVPESIWKCTETAVLESRPKPDQLSFKLNQWPLFRVWVDTQRQQFGLAVHHIIADGGGAVNILKDVGRLYLGCYIPFLPKLASFNDQSVGELARRQNKMRKHPQFKVAVGSIMEALEARPRTSSLELDRYTALAPIDISARDISVIQGRLLSSSFSVKASDSRVIQWLFSWCRILEMKDGSPLPIRKQRGGSRDLPIGYHAGTRVYQPPPLLFDFPEFCSESMKNETCLSQIKVEEESVLDLWPFEALKEWSRLNRKGESVPEQIDEYNYLGQLPSPPPPFPAAFVYHQFRKLDSDLSMGKWRSPAYDPQCVATVSKVGADYQMVLGSYQLDRDALDAIAMRVRMCLATVRPKQKPEVVEARRGLCSYFAVIVAMIVFSSFLVKSNNAIEFSLLSDLGRE